MKKKLILVTGCYLILNFTAFGQAAITLKKSDFPSPSTPFTLSAVAAKTAGVTLPTIGDNQTWKYETIQKLAPISVTYTKNNDTYWTNGQFRIDSSVLSFGTSMNFYFNTIMKNDNSGWSVVGREIPSQGKSLTASTGGASDTIYFATQKLAYSTPADYLKYPCTANTSWTSKNVWDANFKITVALAALNNTPGARRTYLIQKDTVAGYGTLVVPTDSGKPSRPYNVLLTRRTLITIDSFFLNGNPAPAAILTPLGIKQGAMAVTTRDLFWRSGTLNPLLAISYSDSFKTISKASWDDSVSETPKISIRQNKIQLTAHVYPNPVSQSSTTIFLNESAKSNVITVYNSLGQVVFNENSVNQSDINLYTKNWASGIYTYAIQNNFGVAQGKIIIQ